MAPGLQKFQIIMDSPDNVFLPGDLVKGKIVMKLRRTKSIRGLKLQIRGKAEVSWLETSGFGENETTNWYIADEEYFHLEFCLLGASRNSENIDIQSGHHEFPFSFHLPHDIPSSFEHKNGNVKYTIKAVMNTSRKKEHKVSGSIMVQTPHEITQYPSVMNIIEDEIEQTFCYFPCLAADAMKIRIYVPRTGFAVGDTIEAKIDINNYSSIIEVTEVKLFIEQKIILHSRSPCSKADRCSRIMQKMKKKRPFKRNANIMMSLQVPMMPPSNFPNCSIIDLEYRLKVKIFISGCHRSMEGSYPIIIGTRSAIDAQPMPNYVPFGLVQNPTVRSTQPNVSGVSSIMKDTPTKLELAN